jgi:hypothetical protein
LAANWHDSTRPLYANPLKPLVYIPSL